ncbi:hypothetical protein Hanom_Chr15g01384491 [Helianthus anomalus]
MARKLTRYCFNLCDYTNCVIVPLWISVEFLSMCLVCDLVDSCLFD